MYLANNIFLILFYIFILKTEKFQSGIPLVLTETLYILQTVNPQILLLLKTNDLIRGIDTSLGTVSK